jgi:hypothetical protein
MDDKIFKMYEKIRLFLSDDEKVTFNLGFTLGIGEGIAQCTKKLKESKK